MIVLMDQSHDDTLGLKILNKSAVGDAGQLSVFGIFGLKHEVG